MVNLRAIFRVMTLGLVAWLPGSASAQSPGADQHDWMYRQYLQLNRYVRGGTVEPGWLSDGRRFWFVDHGADEAPVYLVARTLGVSYRHRFKGPPGRPIPMVSPIMQVVRILSVF